jgi:signal transduction histidine kinase
VLVPLAPPGDGPSLRNLSAGVAHHINNPLTYVLLNLEHVLRRLRAAGASDDPAAELTAGGPQRGLATLIQALENSVEGANRIGNVVKDLVDLAHGNADETAPAHS